MSARRIIELRVPYPMGFFAKQLDGRIDDPAAGWKGRGLWVTSGNRTPVHIRALTRPIPARREQQKPRGRAPWSFNFSCARILWPANASRNRSGGAHKLLGPGAR